MDFGVICVTGIGVIRGQSEGKENKHCAACVLPHRAKRVQVKLVEVQPIVHAAVATAAIPGKVLERGECVSLTTLSPAPSQLLAQSRHLVNVVFSC